MNCEHHSKILNSAYKLICTLYPPKTTGEKSVNNSKSPLKSPILSLKAEKLFTEKACKKSHGEQVAGKNLNSIRPLVGADACRVIAKRRRVRRLKHLRAKISNHELHEWKPMDTDF
jgi:hypothetical protein